MKEPLIKSSTIHHAPNTNKSHQIHGNGTAHQTGIVQPQCCVCGAEIHRLQYFITIRKTVRAIDNRIATSWITQYFTEINLSIYFLVVLTQIINLFPDH